MQRFDPDELAGVDEPVRRYLEHSIRAGAPLDAGVGLTMAGRIKAGLWMPFTAHQQSDGRSFEWHARVRLGPLTALRVVDRFAGGAGSVDGRLLGRVPLFHADGQDTARSAAGRAASRACSPPSRCCRSMGSPGTPSATT